MINISECRSKEVCRNFNIRCLVCNNQNQFKAKKYLNQNQLRKTPSKKKKGMDFEEQVAVKYNKYLAKRKPLSGGIEGFEGDVETILTLIECKERDQTSRGEKSISIKRKWLERIESEALKHNKLPILVFGFKDGLDEYFTMKYDYLLELLYMNKQQKERIKELERKLEGRD